MKIFNISLKSEVFTAVLVISWLLLVAWSFWWFQLRLQNSMDSFVRDELFSSEQLMLNQSAGAQAPTLYHFYDETCPCTRFNTEHVLKVIEKYGQRGVKFIVVVPDADGLAGARAVFPAAEHRVSRRDFRPPASPSALIVSATSTAEYIGPWSPAAICSSHEDDYVSLVLEELLLRKSFNQSYNLARGCLCPWPVTNSV